MREAGTQSVTRCRETFAPGRLDIPTKKSSPKTVFIMGRVSTADLPSFTQNLMAIFCYNECYMTDYTGDENEFHEKVCLYPFG